MGRFLLVCLGGAIGSGARYLFSTAMSRVFGNFPIGTLGVDTRLFIVTGVLGGFTTYSSFNYETLHLVQSGAAGLAALNVALTLVACLGAGLAGLWVGRLVA